MRRIKVKEKHVTRFVYVPDRPEPVEVEKKTTKTKKGSTKKEDK